MSLSSPKLAGLTAESAKRIFRSLGLNVHSWPSERNLAVDYPVASTPRYGTKTAPHSLISKILQEKGNAFETVLDEISLRTTLLQGIASESTESLCPYWNNGWFPALDATVLMNYILKYRSKRYLEIGSGNSTIFAHHAKTFGGLSTTITSIDPHPRCDIDQLCTKVIRRGLQDVDLAIFDELEEGDILFFDGSHLVFTDSDVTIFFLEVLPRISRGVLVHIHDIFWPLDYPMEWGTRYYSEQYMLAMLLIYAPSRYETLFASAHVSHVFREKVASLTNGQPILNIYGNSYWLKVC